MLHLVSTHSTPTLSRWVGASAGLPESWQGEGQITFAFLLQPLASLTPCPLCVAYRRQVMWRNVTAAATEHRVSVVQGASRGLGLEFVRQLLLRPGEVVATCRNPTEQGARGLLDLQREHRDRLRVLRLDTWEVDSINEAVSSVEEAYGHINLLLNVSGVLHVPGLMSPETSLQKLTLENMERAFRTNAFGPVLVCRGFLPLLVSAGKEGQATEQKPAVVANLSARVGSIGDNGLGGWYSYRASKAALNQFTKTLSIEAARKGHVAAVALHPGTCDTDLTLPFQKNVKPEKLFSREKGVSQLLQIIDSLTMEDAGRFIAWDGKDVPW